MMNFGQNWLVFWYRNLKKKTSIFNRHHSRSQEVPAKKKSVKSLGFHKKRPFSKIRICNRYLFCRKFASFESLESKHFRFNLVYIFAGRVRVSFALRCRTPTRQVVKKKWSKVIESYVIFWCCIFLNFYVLGRFLT